MTRPFATDDEAEWLAGPGDWRRVRILRSVYDPTAREMTYDVDALDGRSSGYNVSADRLRPLPELPFAQRMRALRGP